MIVGAITGVSYGKSGPNDCWRDVFLQEVSSRYNRTSPFHWSFALCRLSALLKLSACAFIYYHLFLVGLLEAMSTGLPVVGLQHHRCRGGSPWRTGSCGFLFTNFFIRAVNNLITDRTLAAKLGQQARQLVLDRFSLQHCVPRQLSLIQLVASGGLG